MGKLNLIKGIKAAQRRRAAGRRKMSRKSNALSLGRYNAYLSGFPRQKVVKMRYCDRYQDTLNGAGYSIRQWRANGVFDPDFTGTGHQPLGYDQWSQLYNHVVVLGSKISVMLSGADNSASGCIFSNLSLSDDTTVSTDVTTLIEYGLGTSRMGQGYAANSMNRLLSKYSAKKFFNVKDVKDNLDRIGSAIGANPTDPAIYNLTIQSEPSMTVEFLVLIEYICLFSEPKELPQS